MNISEFLNLFRLREPSPEVLEKLKNEKDSSTLKLGLVLWYVSQILISLMFYFKIKEVLNFFGF